ASTALFPSTTLFRSRGLGDPVALVAHAGDDQVLLGHGACLAGRGGGNMNENERPAQSPFSLAGLSLVSRAGAVADRRRVRKNERSEEHTSGLLSREN